MEIMVFGRRIWFIQRFVGSLAKNMGSNVISSGRVFLKLSSTQSQLEIATFMVTKVVQRPEFQRSKFQLSFRCKPNYVLISMDKLT